MEVAEVGFAREAPLIYFSYCINYLLETMGTVFERAMYNRLLPFIKLVGADVIAMVVDLARKVMSVTTCCSVVMLDVRNTFDSNNGNILYLPQRLVARYFFVKWFHIC